MPEPIGYRRWAISEGHIPGSSNGGPELESHETACILNASDDDAHVEIQIFFTDREPAGPYLVTVPARRTKHLRFVEDMTQREIGAALGISQMQVSRVLRRALARLREDAAA